MFWRGFYLFALRFWGRIQFTAGFVNVMIELLIILTILLIIVVWYCVDRFQICMDYLLLELIISSIINVQISFHLWYFLDLFFKIIPGLEYVDKFWFLLWMKLRILYLLVLIDVDFRESLLRHWTLWDDVDFSVSDVFDVGFVADLRSWRVVGVIA